MPPRFFFVRHGEAAHNPFIVKGKAEIDPEKAAPLLRQGRSILNPRLTEKGREQAATLRKQLEESGMAFDLLITVPASQTVYSESVAMAYVPPTTPAARQALLYGQFACLGFAIRDSPAPHAMRGMPRLWGCGFGLREVRINR